MEKEIPNRFCTEGTSGFKQPYSWQNRNVAKLQLSDGAGCVVEAVYFGEADEFVDRIKTVEVWRSHIILRSTVIREEKLYRS